MNRLHLRTGTFGWFVLFVSLVLAFAGTKCATYQNPKSDQSEAIQNIDNMTRGFGQIGLILAGIGLVALLAAESFVRRTSDLRQLQKGAFIALGAVTVGFFATLLAPSFAGFAFFLLLIFLNLNLLVYAASMERPR